MVALLSSRSKEPGLSDLFEYAALIEDGIVQGRNGALIAGFFFRGDDAASATASEQNYLTAMVNTYLSRLGSGWTIWVDAARLPSPGYPSPDQSFFTNPITAMIDAERRARFAQADMHYESEYALIIQFIPELRRNTRVDELFYDDDGRDNSAPGDRLVAEFKKRLNDLQDGLGELLHMRRMGAIDVGQGDDSYLSDELINYLHFAITGDTIALRIPDCPMYLDSWLGYPDFRPGDTPKVGNKYVACVAIDGFPGVSYPGILDMLEGLPVAYRWSSRFIFLDQHQAVYELNRYRLKWQQKVRGFWSQVIKSSKGVINTDALAMTQEAEQAMSDAKSGLVAYGYYTPVVVLMHKSRRLLEEQARYVRREIERRGFAARVETVNAPDAWLGTLPGNIRENVRRPLVHTLNLADLLPLSGVWPGLQENPCDFYPTGSPALMQTVTTGATPFRLNLHVGDVGHTLIFGPTGAGKSTLLATLLAQADRYHGNEMPPYGRLPANITAFDKGRSLYALCHAIGGVHYDIGTDEGEPLAVCPLADIDRPSDALWAEEWISICYELQAGHPLIPQQKSEIHRSIEILRSAPVCHRSMTDFCATVQNQEIRDALNHYTISGAMGHLLDGQRDDMHFSSFTVFEIDELMKLGDKNAIPVLLYLFRRFEKSLLGQPSFLSLDEGWVMLGHPVFREKLREWLKELRKKNCAVILATQSLSDAVNSGLLDVLIEQCPTKILLPNKEADLHGTKDNPGPADLYKVFGLNEREIKVLKTGQYKKHYYYKSPLGRRLFELGLGPLALSFVAVSDKESLATIRDMQDAHGADWPLYWLQKRGIEYDQYLS
ncbi:transporter (plasmid) [Nitrosomonas europaea]|uniref:VirB4 family type IV secretion/conjugal transfer ATPase n=1 Tax=Nitrosomonas europaea TaxID=915 RepID=UPI003263345C